MEFMYLVFTRMPGETYRRRFRSLLLYLCYDHYILHWTLLIYTTFNDLDTISKSQGRQKGKTVKKIYILFRALYNSLVGWFCTSAPSLVLFQTCDNSGRVWKRLPESDTGRSQCGLIVSTTRPLADPDTCTPSWTTEPWIRTAQCPTLRGRKGDTEKKPAPLSLHNQGARAGRCSGQRVLAAHSEHRFPAPSSKLPGLVTPLKGHSLTPRSRPPTRSAPSERFGYWSHSEHRFPAPSSKLCQIWLRHWRGTLYLGTAVHRRGQNPPRSLGTNNYDCKRSAQARTWTWDCRI